MSEGQTNEGPVGVHSLPDAGYGWVADCPIESFVRRMQAIRVGDRANGEEQQPATAIRLLHIFAIRRSIDDLLKAASAPTLDATSTSRSKARLSYWDSVNMLATAALCRRPEHA